jgi:hypothetical protein
MSLSHNLSRADGAKMRLAVDAVSLLTFTSIWILVMSGKQILKIDLVWRRQPALYQEGWDSIRPTSLKLFSRVLVSRCVSRIYEANFLWCCP